MPNATAFIAADRYLLLLDAEGQNPRPKAEGMPNATAFTAADRYLLLLDADGQNPRHKADGMPNATAFTAADHYLLLLDAKGQNPLRGLAKLNAIPVYSIGNIVFKRVGRHVLPLARGQRRARNKRRFKVAANCYLRPSIDSREQREVLQVGDLGVPSGEGRPFKNSMAFGIFHQGRTSRRKFSSLTGLKRVGKFLPLN